MVLIIKLFKLLFGVVESQKGILDSLRKHFIGLYMNKLWIFLSTEEQIYLKSTLGSYEQKLHVLGRN